MHRSSAPILPTENVKLGKLKHLNKHIRVKMKNYATVYIMDQISLKCCLNENDDKWETFLIRA